MSGVPVWRVIRSANDPKFMVKGYELADCLYGTNSRFRIAEVRTFPDGFASAIYRVYDAETVTDAEVKAGVSPRCVGSFATFGDATAWCDAI